MLGVFLGEQFNILGEILSSFGATPEEDGNDWASAHTRIACIRISSLPLLIMTGSIHSLYRQRISFVDYFLYGLYDKGYRKLYSWRILAFDYHILPYQECFVKIK